MYVYASTYTHTHTLNLNFPEVNWLGRGIDHPPLHSAKVKERVELYLCSTSGPLWPVIVWTLPLAFTC